MIMPLCDGHEYGSALREAPITEELAMLRRHLAVCGVGADMPAGLGAAYEAFEFLVAALEAGPRFAACLTAAGLAADGRDKLALAPSLLPIYEAFPRLHSSAHAKPVAADELLGLCRDLAEHLDRIVSATPEE